MRAVFDSRAAAAVRRGGRDDAVLSPPHAETRRAAKVQHICPLFPSISYGHVRHHLPFVEVLELVGWGVNSISESENHGTSSHFVRSCFCVRQVFHCVEPTSATTDTITNAQEAEFAGQFGQTEKVNFDIPFCAYCAAEDCFPLLAETTLPSVRYFYNK